VRKVNAIAQSVLEPNVDRPGYTIGKPMPVDHDRRLLFIHIPKTGGTSILTLLGLWKKARSPDLQILFGEFGAADLQHLTLAQAEQFLTPDEVATYFKFGFVRNPWDRAVSAALWQTRFSETGVRDLADFIDWAEAINRRGARSPSEVHALPQSAFLRGNSGGLDCIGRFENYERDVRRILGRFISLPKDLPHKLERPGSLPYRDYYYGGFRERVAKLYAEDIARFGYTF
jgi:chondroitin 4-sulfotransferase 11